jgi:hypothetical protein
MFVAVLIVVAFVPGLSSSTAAAGRLDPVVEPQGGYQTIYCASDDGKRRYCGADTRGGCSLCASGADRLVTRADVGLRSQWHLGGQGLSSRILGSQRWRWRWRRLLSGRSDDLLRVG